MKRLLMTTAAMVWGLISLNVYAQKQNNSMIVKTGDAQGDTTYRFRSSTSGIVKPPERPFAYDGHSKAYSNDTSNGLNINYQSNTRLLPNFGGIR
jgi:hypothetical protein